MTKYFCGLDIGQAADYTAFCVLEKEYPRRPPEPEQAVRGEGIRPVLPPLPPIYHGVFLERLPLGTPYPDMVRYMVDRMQSAALRDAAILAIDATGVGKPVVDMIKQAGIKPYSIIIHGGQATTVDKGTFHVPKRDLISLLQVLLQAGRLRFAPDLPEAATLKQELKDYRVTISDAGHDSYNAREGEHDDLVLACAIAAWAGERPRPTRLPPAISFRTWH